MATVTKHYGFHGIHIEITKGFAQHHTFDTHTTHIMCRGSDHTLTHVGLHLAVSDPELFRDIVHDLQLEVTDECTDRIIVSIPSARLFLDPELSKLEFPVNPKLVGYVRSTPTARCSIHEGCCITTRMHLDMDIHKIAAQAITGGSSLTIIAQPFIRIEEVPRPYVFVIDGLSSDR